MGPAQCLHMASPVPFLRPEAPTRGNLHEIQETIFHTEEGRNRDRERQSEGERETEIETDRD